MRDRLDYLEFAANEYLDMMSNVESRIAEILSFNDILNASAQLDPELSGAISTVQDELESEFNSLVSLFDALESELDALGDEYDSLVFVVSLALPA